MSSADEEHYRHMSVAAALVVCNGDLANLDIEGIQLRDENSGMDVMPQDFTHQGEAGNPKHHVFKVLRATYGIMGQPELCCDVTAMVEQYCRPKFDGVMMTNVNEAILRMNCSNQTFAEADPSSTPRPTKSRTRNYLSSS